MSKRRTRYPKHPGRVLTRALQLGLTAVANLARYRITEQTKHLYYGSEKTDSKEPSGIKNIWEHYLREYRQSVKDKKPDARYLQKAETNMRRNHYKLHFNIAARYGNTEEKRRRRHDDKRYLNILMDYTGSRLRDVAGVDYLLPKTQNLLIDGEELLGYMGSSKIPLYIPRHKAPELDFIDMIRGHLDVLQIQCLRYNVPIRNAMRYSDKLIYTLCPYLDYVFTEGETGKGNFTQDSLKDLRQMILEIRARWGRRNGRAPSLTDIVKANVGNVLTFFSDESQDDSPPESPFEDDLLAERYDREDNDTQDQDNIEVFWNQLSDSCDTEMHSEWNKYVRKLKQLVKKGVLNKRDALFVHDLLREDSRQTGVRFHRYMANSDWTYNPFSVFQAVIQDSDATRDHENPVFFSELPILNGRGRIDLTVSELFTRKRGDDTDEVGVYRPRIIVDFKTKSAYNLDLYATKTKSKKDPNRRVMEPDFESRRMTKDEWDEVVRCTPTDYEQEQLRLYEEFLLADYKRVSDNEDEIDVLSKAILVVDAGEDWNLIRNCLRECILKVFSKQRPKSNERTVYHLEIDGRRLHAALVVLNHDSILQAEKECEKEERCSPFDFVTNKDPDRFTLYLPVAGRGSPSRSAAKIAGNWYLIQYLHTIYHKNNSEILWLDLTGEYANSHLRARRLRFDTQSKEIREFIEANIRFIDFSECARGTILEGQPLSVLRKNLTEVLPSSKTSVVVVSGYDTYRQVIQPQRRTMLDEVQLLFIEMSDFFSSLIWIDQPVPLTKTNQKYGQRCVAPFYPTSHWKQHIGRIIWNLPMYPYRAGSFAPADDDFRLIVEETQNECEKELVQISILYRWGERFRSEGEMQSDPNESIFLKGGYATSSRGRSPRTYYDEDFDTPLGLLPHLGFENETLGSEVKLIVETTSDHEGNSPLVLQRTAFTPFQIKTTKKKDQRVKKLEPLKRINHRRQYRKTRLYAESPKWSTRPPHELFLTSSDFEEGKMVTEEISALKNTITVLKKETIPSDRLESLFETIEQYIEHIDDENDFHHLQTIRKIIERATIEEWSGLRRYRNYPPLRLNDYERKFIEESRLHHPNILLMVGNDLYVLILAALLSEEIIPTAHLLEDLWDWVLPWQLIRLGMTPIYPENHTTGISVFSSSMIYRTLRSRLRDLQELQKSQGVEGILFGQILSAKSEIDGEQVRYVWLTFQSHPGSNEMNAISLSPRYFSNDIRSSLKTLTRDKPFWGDSDLTRMSLMLQDTKSKQHEVIMIGYQHGVRGLWILDDKKKEWTPIGRFDYFLLKREVVTLIRSLSIRPDRTLTSIRTQDVRGCPENLSDLVDTSLGIIGVAYRICERAKCIVSIDYATAKYKLHIHKEKSSEERKDKIEITLSSTIDLIELLRRPGTRCEPVIMQGNSLTWNHFSDIAYEDDATLLRPWVERKKPFRGTGISLPKSSEELVHAVRRTAIDAKVCHHVDTCPLSRQNVDDETPNIEHTSREEYLRYLEGEPGQPDEVISETIRNHGICWSFDFQNSEDIPKDVRSLDKIKFSGFALATILRTGALIYSEGTDWFIQDLKIPDESNLPREFQECAHLVKAYRQIVPKAALELEIPGTFIHELGERWIIHLSARIDHVTWSARSDTSGQYFRNQTFTIPLYFDRSLEEMEEYVVTSIEEVIPKQRIFNFDRLKHLVRNELKIVGFRDDKIDRKPVSDDSDKEPHTRTHWEMLTSHTQLKQEAIKQQKEGRIQEALTTISRDIIELEDDFRSMEKARIPLIDALLTKAEIMIDESSKITVIPRQIVDMLGKVYTLSMGLEGRILSSNSEFAQRIRWGFTLREKLTGEL